MPTAYDPLWLDRAMKRAGVRTGQLAAISKVSRSQIQRIRNGSAPRMDTMVALQAALTKLAPGKAKGSISQERAA